MNHHPDTADRHAAERERKKRKERYGMRVRGRSIHLLARLGTPPALPRARGKKSSSRSSG